MFKYLTLISYTTLIVNAIINMYSEHIKLELANIEP